MKLIIFALLDRVTGEYEFTFNAKNVELMKRNVKGTLMSKEANIFNVNTDDKDIFQIGEYDTFTGRIDPTDKPEFICHVEDLRQDLIAEVRRRKFEAEQAGASVEGGEIANE